MFEFNSLHTKNVRWYLYTNYCGGSYLIFILRSCMRKLITAKCSRTELVFLQVLDIIFKPVQVIEIALPEQWDTI